MFHLLNLKQIVSFTPFKDVIYYKVPINNYFLIKHFVERTLLTQKQLVGTVFFSDFFIIYNIKTKS